MELAQYVESNGKLGRLINSGALLTANKTWLDDGYLCWAGGGGREVQPSVDVLDRFIGLWQRDDRAILKFAKTYGTLRGPLWALRERRSGLEGREPLKAWRASSQRAFDLLTIAATLRTRDAARLTFEQWGELSGGRLRELKIEKLYLRRTFLAPDHRSTVDMVKLYLRREIASWNATLGPVSFGIERDYDRDGDLNSGWRTVLDFGGSMPCYIGLQLMLVIAAGDFFICSACRKPYIHARGRSAPKGMRKAPRARNVATAW